MEAKKAIKKTRIGSVISNKMDKSVVVQVDRKVRHKFYGKFIHQRVKYMADDPAGTCNIGDRVMIEECRPLSKRKRWRVREIIAQAL
ncbi:MAG: 30S ribosomal protein S17 [Deltaproteobacteria bacterium RIFOXYD12_FULL_57_12]|nr:MAG: 30S ribosomal protein S17 [Deltaproteobacteria bacterium RIFOXYD12_FULL_57_12]